jgi:hypothetical protein
MFVSGNALGDRSAARAERRQCRAGQRFVHRREPVCTSKSIFTEFRHFQVSTAEHRWRPRSVSND